MRVGEGDRAACEKLIPLVYAELKRLARRHLARERGQTLQGTALGSFTERMDGVPTSEIAIQKAHGDTPGHFLDAHSPSHARRP